MGLRFRKSFKLAPGVRMNIGLRSLSMSLGPRGASVSLGARGVYSNVGIPGTGLSFRERIDGSSPGRSAASSPPSLAGKAVSFRLQDDGSVEIVDPEGNPLPARVIKLARTQNEQMLRSWLEEKCAHWNQGIEASLGIHLTTPRPDRPLDTQRKPFKEPRPDEPQLKPLGFWGRLFRHRREQIERSNAQAMEAHASATLTWERERIEHNERETQRLHLLDASAVPNHEEAQEYLSAALAQIE